MERAEARTLADLFASKRTSSFVCPSYIIITPRLLPSRERVGHQTLVTRWYATRLKRALPGMRVAPQSLLHLDRQAVHSASHVGVPDRQPHSHTRWDWDHRRANASMTAAAKAGDTAAGIRTRALPANSISIAGIGGAAMPSPDGAISTRAKPLAAARKSRRQR